MLRYPSGGRLQTIDVTVMADVLTMIFMTLFGNTSLYTTAMKSLCYFIEVLRES